MKQGGAVANSNGRVLENIVESSLNTKGFTSINYKDWHKDPTTFGEEVLIKNVPYLNVYNHASKTEFVIRSKKHSLDTRIECKWQQASGSVDEKYPFLFINCAERMNEPQIIILLDGGGAKPGAINWLRCACESFNLQQKEGLKRRIDLMNSTEFLQWVNRTLK